MFASSIPAVISAVSYLSFIVVLIVLFLDFLKKITFSFVFVRMLV